jgi:molybdate transport system substrate-binding protein
MSRGCRTLLCTIALMFCANVTAIGAEIRVLSVGSVQAAVKAMAVDFTKATGHQVTLKTVTPADIPRNLASAPYDMVICSIAAMDVLEKGGAVQPNSRSPLARVGIGVMVRKNAPQADVSTPEAFKKTLLDAISIVHGDPYVPNQSGVVTMRILAKAGLLEAVRTKSRPAPLAEGLEWVANGDVEIGLFNRVELPAGVRLAGPVPEPFADFTFYETAVLAQGSAPVEATAFIRRMTSPNARKDWDMAEIEGYPYRN